MRRAASDPATLALPFSSIRPQGRSSHFSLLLGPIYRTLEGWGTLPLPILYFLVNGKFRVLRLVLLVWTSIPLFTHSCAVFLDLSW